MIRIILISFVLKISFLTVNAQQIHSVMINACGANEGANEYFLLQNGNAAFVANATNISLRYGTTSPASGNYTSSFLAAGNPNFVNRLNSKLTGGCKFVFKNAPVGTTILPNKYFMVMYDSPTDTANYSAWCNVAGMDTVYVLFSNTPLWSVAGNFVNNSSSLRYFRSIINGVTNDYNYVYAWASNIDGNYVKFPIGGGAASNYANSPSCTPNSVIALPTELVSFNGVLKSNFLNFSAVINSDKLNSKWKLEYSANLQNWHVINSNYVLQSNTIQVSKYLEMDVEKIYIRFTEKENQHEIGPLLVQNTSSNTVAIWPNPFNSALFINSETEGSYELTYATGKTALNIQVQEGVNLINTESLSSGIYFIEINNTTYKVIK